jgi:hypothetical protein
MSLVAVLGGYGTFGARVSHELARRGHRVTVAGRHLHRAEALARALGPEHRAAAADARDLASCVRAAEGATVLVVCAGPFSTIGDAPARAALHQRAHYVDIADDRDYIRRLATLDPEFRAAERCAAYGCSSLPAVSSALALSLVAPGTPAPERAGVTLFIGSANPKGRAAVRAMVERLGRPMRTAEGERSVFADPAPVPLPPPFGTRTAYTFDGPEHDLFPRLLGVRSVDVRVGFELGAANAGFALLARMGARWGRRTAALLSAAAALAPRVGGAGGAVRVELRWSDGAQAARTVLAGDEGQRMAALPCAVVADALASPAASPPVTGVRAPTEVVGAPLLLSALREAGLAVVDG